MEAAATSPDEDLESLAAVAGAIFASVSHPFAAISVVESRLRGEDVSDEDLASLGVPPALIEEYGTMVAAEGMDLRLLLSCGAAWAAGLRAQPPTSIESWRPVVSGANLQAPEFPNRTGETLVQLIMKAVSQVRFAPAYFDCGAARYLAPSVAGATRRGVDVQVLIVDKLEREDASLELGVVVGERGSRSRLSVKRGVASDWFAHMKVLTVDSRAAYVGSANSTIAGLTTNFELGTLVEGPGVAVIDSFLDRVVGRWTRARDEVDPMGARKDFAPNLLGASRSRPGPGTWPSRWRCHEQAPRCRREVHAVPSFIDEQPSGTCSRSSHGPIRRTGEDRIRTRGSTLANKVGSRTPSAFGNTNGNI